MSSILNVSFTKVSIAFDVDETNGFRSGNHAPFFFRFASLAKSRLEQEALDNVSALA